MTFLCRDLCPKCGLTMKTRETRGTTLRLCRSQNLRFRLGSAGVHRSSGRVNKGGHDLG